MTCKEETLHHPSGMLALDKLSQMLYAGHFQPGKAIRETVLASQLNLSRNAIREALNQMVGWDILEYVPFCGYRLRLFSFQDLLDWHALREAIEPVAARLLAERHTPDDLHALSLILREAKRELDGGCDYSKLFQLDQQFHVTLVQLSGNRCFQHLQVAGYFLAHRYASVQHAVQALVQQEHAVLANGKADTRQANFRHDLLTAAKHEEILSYISADDAAAAEASTRDHMMVSRNGLKKAFALLRAKTSLSETEFLHSHLES